MKKKDLMALVGVSQSSITKMGHNDNINTEVLVKICLALNCNIGDIAEIILPEEEQGVKL
jgi:putative transcriptional regulator